MHQEGKNDAMFRRMFKNAYEAACESLYENWLELVKKSDIANNQNVKVEINAFVYFIFDLSFSLGPETEIRNTLRRFLAEGVEGTKIERDIYNNRAIEYITELQKNIPENKKMLNFGNVFAEHTENSADILVVTWIVEQMGIIMDLSKAIMDKVLNGLAKRR